MSSLSITKAYIRCYQVDDLIRVIRIDFVVISQSIQKKSDTTPKVDRRKSVHSGLSKSYRKRI